MAAPVEIVRCVVGIVMHSLLPMFYHGTRRRVLGVVLMVSERWLHAREETRRAGFAAR